MQTVINGTAQSNQNYASAIQYAPQGATKQLTYGGSSGILETVTYNSRLQPTQIGATRGDSTSIKQLVAAPVVWVNSSRNVGGGSVIFLDRRWVCGLPTVVGDWLGSRC